MTFAAELAAGDFPVALEITPPRTSKPEVLLRRARLLGGAPSAVNVIQRVDRQASLDASAELLAAGLEPIWHILARGTTPGSLDESIARANQLGVRNVLCILGDRPTEGPSLKVRDLVAACEGGIKGAFIGATFNQYGEDRERALHNLFGKLEAGASFVETQPVFTPAALDWLIDRVGREFPDARVMAMVMPITTPGVLARMEARLGIPVPGEFAASVAAGAKEAWAAFEQLLAALHTARIVDGVAIMTPEMDPSPETGALLRGILRRNGIGRTERSTRREGTLP